MVVCLSVAASVDAFTRQCLPANVCLPVSPRQRASCGAYPLVHGQLQHRLPPQDWLS
jgi:hypothetical protein